MNSDKIIFCTSTCNRGYCIDWVIAAVYNVVDQIVIWDSSPFGPSNDGTENILRELVGEKNLCVIDHMSKDIGDLPLNIPEGYKVYFIRDNWFDYHQDYRNVPMTPYKYLELTAMARTKTLAMFVADLLGCDWIHWSDSDEIFYPNIAFLRSAVIPEMNKRNICSVRFGKIGGGGSFDRVSPILKSSWEEEDHYAQLGFFRNFRGIAYGGWAAHVSTLSVSDPLYISKYGGRFLQQLTKLVWEVHVTNGNRPGFVNSLQLTTEKYRRTRHVLFQLWENHKNTDLHDWALKEIQGNYPQFDENKTTLEELYADIEKIVPPLEQVLRQGVLYGGPLEDAIVPRFKPLVMRMDSKEYIVRGYPNNIKNVLEFDPISQGDLAKLKGIF